MGMYFKLPAFFRLQNARSTYLSGSLGRYAAITRATLLSIQGEPDAALDTFYFNKVEMSERTFWLVHYQELCKLCKHDGQ